MSDATKVAVVFQPSKPSPNLYTSKVVTRNLFRGCFFSRLFRPFPAFLLPQQCIGPQLLGRSFQKTRNFTASSHQNAGLSIWVFKNFPGLIPRTLTAGGRPPPAPNTQRGAQASRCWGPNLGLLNFSAVVTPLPPIFPPRRSGLWNPAKEYEGRC